MDIGSIFTTSFLVAFTGAMMPGPLLAVTVGESMKKGFWAGPVIILGHAILELALVLLLMLGVAAVLSGQGAKNAIGLIGGLFLILLGMSMMRDVLKGKVSLSLDEKRKEVRNAHHRVLRGWLYPATAGILSSLANPYWSIWWATVGLLYITQALKSGYMGVASFYSGHILADLAWYSLISGVIAGGRRFISQKLYNGILIVCSIFIVFLGVYFLKGSILDLL